MPFSNNTFYLLLETIDELKQIDLDQSLKPRRSNSIEPVYDEDETKWGSAAWLDTPPNTPPNSPTLPAPPQ